MAQERARAGKGAAFRKVQCYHCRQTFDVGARAMTITCPKCFKRVQVQDVVVKEAQGLKRLQTCGKIIIERKGRVIADLVEAHEGIEVKGILQAAVVAGGPVVLRSKSKWKGDCRAPELHIDEGASIQSGFFEIAGAEASARLGLGPLPGVAGARAHALAVEEEADDGGVVADEAPEAEMGDEQEERA